MNILICGRGKGSWIMRGEQIGAALGARVTSDPTAADWGWADVAILIKKTAVEYARPAHAAKVPIVWDVLDCWSQPRDNAWSVEQGVQWVRQLARQIKPVALIAATQRMAEDIGGIYIPHHCRIGLTPTPPRDEVRIVGYDGSERYLGACEAAIRDACRHRGWSFVINPPDLRAVDLLVAFRDGWWDGPICRAWKSGVKYVNALCAGRPIIGQAAAGVLGGHGTETLIHDFAELDQAFDMVSVRQYRGACYLNGNQFGVSYMVDVIAEMHYRPLLERVCAEASCAA